MSLWTHINGIITVHPYGRTQHEMTYVLNTILDHLPIVTGSEKDMNVTVISKKGCNCSGNTDEFDQQTNNLFDDRGDRSRKRGSLYLQDEYLIIVESDFRDRLFEQTYREFMRWLFRLAKRCIVWDTFVRISNDCDKNVILNFGTNSFLFDMYEYPSTSFGNKTGEPSWTEYLYWKPVARNINIPIEHIYKYYNEDLVSTEIERRTEFKNHYSKVIEQRINADY